jgi:hypothetical protein
MSEVDNGPVAEGEVAEGGRHHHPGKRVIPGCQKWTEGHVCPLHPTPEQLLTTQAGISAVAVTGAPSVAVAVTGAPSVAGHDRMLGNTAKK